MRYHLTPFGMSTIKKTTISNACKDVEKKNSVVTLFSKLDIIEEDALCNKTGFFGTNGDNRTLK